MASLKIACITVGEQITAEQLVEKCIIMKISKAMMMNIGITPCQVDQNDSASTTITPHIDHYPACI